MEMKITQFLLKLAQYQKNSLCCMRMWVRGICEGGVIVLNVDRSKDKKTKTTRGMKKDKNNLCSRCRVQFIRKV